MTMTTRPYANALNRLKDAGLRPTRQRLALTKLLFENGHRHVTAEQLHTEALSRNIRVSLATVYNTLHQFTEADLLREIIVDPGRSYFDTNTNRPPPFLLCRRRFTQRYSGRGYIVAECSMRADGNRN